MPIIQALDRALKIVDLFDDQHTELKITEISAKMNLHKSTVHSLLKTLQLHGYIAQDEESGKYRLGMRFVEKGQQLLHNLDIRGVARLHLRRLSAATGQTTHLVTLEGREAIYLDKVEGEKAAIRYSRIGRRVPLHTSAAGKVLAAFQTEADRMTLMEGYAFERRTDHTIESLEPYMQELNQVKRRGFAIDNEENEPGVRCAAAPIFNHNGKVTAAMSISTMVAHVNDEELQLLIKGLCEETEHISKQLGYRI